MSRFITCTNKSQDICIDTYDKCHWYVIINLSISKQDTGRVPYGTPTQNMGFVYLIISKLI